MSQIGAIFNEHDQLFVTNNDRETLILIVFLIFERLKGDDSFWSPYIDLVDAGIPSCYWPDEVKAKNDVQELDFAWKDAVIRCDAEWDKLKSLFGLYP